MLSVDRAAQPRPDRSLTGDITTLAADDIVKVIVDVFGEEDLHIYRKMIQKGTGYF